MSLKKILRREQVATDSERPIFLGDFEDDRLAPIWHFHSEVELIFIVKGGGMRHVRDSVEEFEAGDMCLIGPNVPHCWTSRPVRGERVHALFIQFSKDIFGRDFWAQPFASPVQSLLERAERGVLIQGETRHAVFQKMMQLIHDCSHPLDKLSCLLSLLSRICQSSECRVLGAHPGASRDGAEARVQQLARYLEEHFTRKMPESEAAQLVGLSAAAFSRWFRVHFGVPFVKYITCLRVQRACELLMETQDGVASVAEAAGFSSLSNFNRHFLLAKGVAPRAYRSKARGLVARSLAEEHVLTRCRLQGCLRDGPPITGLDVKK